LRSKRVRCARYRRNVPRGTWAAPICRSRRDIEFPAFRQSDLSPLDLAQPDRSSNSQPNVDRPPADNGSYATLSCETADRLVRARRLRRHGRYGTQGGNACQ
jgi:hypothetical protein